MAAEAPDRDFVLLGIKYEAAKVGGVSDASLAAISERIQAEVGEGWETDKQVLRGRNAVRAEHGLSRLGESARRSPELARDRRPFLSRLFGR